MTISRWSFLKMRNIVEKIRTPVLFSITVFQKSCRLRNNVENYGRGRQATGDNIIRRMRIACWLAKVTDTHSVCNTCCLYTATMVIRTCIYVMSVCTLPVLFSKHEFQYGFMKTNLKQKCWWYPVAVFIRIIIGGEPNSGNIRVISNDVTFITSVIKMYF